MQTVTSIHGRQAICNWRCNENISRRKAAYDDLCANVGLENRWNRSAHTSAKTVDKVGKSGIIKEKKYKKIAINTEHVYRQAKNQNRHAGIYNDAFNKSRTQLNKSINSHQMQVDEHFNKLNNSEKYDADWNNKNEKQKQGLLKKWQKDMIRNAEQAEIEMRVFDERF